ncbi:hypothetical protein LZF89_09270 [Streptococcus suis]|uniref:hypothetical protein n=1 Tax=Streptococcus suis TaxID=1307 RepID=UPI000CF5AFE6|nr:hypothetical protein [Streptococcus suis]MCE6986967.1 hypothetical protein [Streptococcus suis]NQI44067.1 hypothetical protein [Streptococcus suis]NQK10347.1 hypothetical protein [Streptococcus suis]HEL1653944.1 hypothetical protein [Streptococcus suis]
MKKLLTISMCVATLFMTACGNTQDTSNGSSKSTEISGEMTFGDYINSSGRKIFYQFSDDNFSKDTYIHRISVIEDQQITSYAIEELAFAMIYNHLVMMKSLQKLRNCMPNMLKIN